MTQAIVSVSVWDCSNDIEDNPNVYFCSFNDKSIKIFILFYTREY